MTYTVVILTRAKLELYNDALWWAEHHDQEQAARWLEQFIAALDRLSENPQQHPLARESDLFDFEMRSLHFGVGKRTTHRALFRIRDDRVVVYTVRHVARADVSQNEIL